MKVAVITRHAVPNYGSLLQAIAMQKVIENLGHTCEIIDYVRKDETYCRREVTMLHQKSGWKNPLKKLMYLFVRQPSSIVTGQSFERRKHKFLQLSRRYATLDELKADTPEADVYMTGSDQVWGPVENGSYDSVYCLSFTNKKKIAYGASFGRSEMQLNQKVFFREYLSTYCHIAVREDSAIEILDSIGIQAYQVLDPTLLLDRTFWEQYVKVKREKKYVMVYQIHNDKKLGEYAKKVAQSKKVELIRVSVSFHQILREGKFVWNPGIEEFLSYLKNTECLITDSFHGTAFAINLNVPFVEVLPNNNTSTRNWSILRMTGLENRILRDVDDIALADEAIDFTYANRVIESARVHSMNILKDMIED